MLYHLSHRHLSHSLRAAKTKVDIFRKIPEIWKIMKTTEILKLSSGEIAIALSLPFALLESLMAELCICTIYDIDISSLSLRTAKTKVDIFRNIPEIRKVLGNCENLEMVIR